MRTILATIALTAAATPALAQWTPEIERRTTAEYTRCLKTGAAARGNDPAMAACGWAELRRQDGRLNRAYGAAMQRLPARRKAFLRTEERRWIAQRDRRCDAVAARYEGGTAAPLEQSGCLIEATIRRTMFLEKYR